VVLAIGSLLNARITRRIAVVAAWLAGFALQAAIRSWIHGTPILAGFVPMTGIAFELFTCYMVPDPATTPGRRSSPSVSQACRSRAW